MSMLPQFGKLFTYDHWANREVLRGLQASQGKPEKAVTLLSHIVGAQKVWLDRLRTQLPTSPVWPDFTLAECEAQIAQLANEWKAFFASRQDAGIDAEVSYKNSKGEAFANRTEDVLLHVIMHSAYHRGQIAMQMRAAGFTPAYTDFIHAVRQEHLTVP